MKDTYRVLPHRNVKVRIDGSMEHKLCGMDLTETNIIEENWCYHCAAVINKSAHQRALAAIRSTYPNAPQFRG